MATRTVIANWKMHGTQADALALARGVRRLLGRRHAAVEVVLAPPFTSLETVRRAVQGSRLRLSAQNLHWQPQGAFTGEVGAEMLRDAGCSYVIVGHSERRRLFGETNRDVGRKLTAALDASLHPVLCIGETLRERHAGKTWRTLSGQLSGALKGVTKSVSGSFTLAYEPVWAIGTGKNATPAQVMEAHRWIRRSLVRRFGAARAEQIPILYGGSVNPQNAPELATVPEVDGALVGGASLDPRSFTAIVGAFAG